SHIKPWKDATNGERTDPNNGLVLSPLYDKLFDKHMISFDEDGKIMLGRDAEALKDAKLILGVERLKFNGSDGKIPEKMRSFMKLHNKEFKRMEAVRDAL